jgi:hypothetical protein
MKNNMFVQCALTGKALLHISAHTHKQTHTQAWPEEQWVPDNNYEMRMHTHTCTYT